MCVFFFNGSQWYKFCCEQTECDFLTHRQNKLKMAEIVEFPTTWGNALPYQFLWQRNDRSQIYRNKYTSYTCRAWGLIWCETDRSIDISVNWLVLCVSVLLNCFMFMLQNNQNERLLFLLSQHHREKPLKTPQRCRDVSSVTYSR